MHLAHAALESGLRAGVVVGHLDGEGIVRQAITVAVSVEGAGSGGGRVRHVTTVSDDRAQSLGQHAVGMQLAPEGARERVVRAASVAVPTDEQASLGLLGWPLAKDDRVGGVALVHDPTLSDVNVESNRRSSTMRR